MPPTAEQLATLRAMSAATLDPTLSDDELLDVLARNAHPDAEHRPPSDDDWTPTYAMGAAAQDAWLIKAGKVAHRVGASDGSLRVDRSDLHAHCMTMAEAYGRRRWGTIVIAGTTGLRERGVLPVFNSDAIPVLEPWTPGGATS